MKIRFSKILMTLIAIGSLASYQSAISKVGEWVKMSDMPSIRTVSDSAVVNGKIYVIGGLNVSSRFVSTVEEYDPSINTWKQKSDDVLDVTSVNLKGKLLTTWAKLKYIR